MALDTTGPWADHTPKMIYNLLFGKKSDYYRMRMAQVQASNPMNSSASIQLAQPFGHDTNQTSERPQRATAKRAPQAWTMLSPKKRQRRY